LMTVIETMGLSRWPVGFGNTHFVEPLFSVQNLLNRSSGRSGQAHPPAYFFHITENCSRILS
jgi:hypothetical protein